MSVPTPLDYGRPTGPRRQRLSPWVSYPILLVAVLALVAALSSGTSSHHSRETAMRARCLSNLHQIGLANLLYAQEHGGTFPDTLATLIREEPDLPPSVLVCDDSTDTPAAAPTTRAVADAVAAGGHCSYVYVGGGLTAATATAATVVAYEPVSHHNGDGCNVLYGDGHAAWVTAAAAAGLPPH